MAETVTLPTLPHKLQLVKPIKWGSEEITEVVIDREPNAGDLVEIMNEKKAGDQLLRMVACATGLEDPKVKAMSARDVMRVTGIVQAFLPGGLGTGN